MTPSPLIEYTNLLHRVKSLDDPKVVAFKEAHQEEPEFECGVLAVEAAFQARWISTPAKAGTPPVAQQG